MKSLSEILNEAKDDIKDMQIAEMQAHLQAVKTSIPKPIAVIRQSLMDSGEYELYEFIQYCEFWEVKNKNAQHWYRTAAVRAANDKIEFYYDKDFIESIANKPGMLMFLIAHEADHIFRFHQDRQDSTGKDGDVWNSATDMIINKDIMASQKIGSWKPEEITNEFMIRDEEEKKEAEKYYKKKWDDIKKEVATLRVPKEYADMIEKNKDSMKLPWTSDRLYNYLTKENKNKKENKEENQNKQKKDYYENGTIVKVNSGEHAGEYRKITGKDNNGKYITIPVDINKEIEKVSGRK